MFNAYTLNLTMHFNKSIPTCHFEQFPEIYLNDVTSSDYFDLKSGC